MSSDWSLSPYFAYLEDPSCRAYLEGAEIMGQSGHLGVRLHFLHRFYKLLHFSLRTVGPPTGSAQHLQSEAAKEVREEGEGYSDGENNVHESNIQSKSLLHLIM